MSLVLIRTIAALVVSLALTPNAGAPTLEVGQQENRLTVTIGSGQGRVTSRPAGINCTAESDPCTATLPSDATVVLTGDPDFGFAVDGWGTPDCPEGSKKRCLIEMAAADRFATAHFRPRAILQIARIGKGTVTAAPEGQTPIFKSSCDFTVDEVTECELAYFPGQRVRLTARPAPGSRFVRWSRLACGRSHQCTARLDKDYQTVTAIFSPLRLGVIASGVGRVRTHDGKIDIRCGGDVCSELTPYDRLGKRVIVLATSTADVTFIGDFCKPLPRHGNVHRCRAFVTNDPTWVGVQFGDAEPPDLPGNIVVAFRVAKAGNGRGAITGSGMNCGSRCFRKYDFGVRRTFTARAFPGSRFTRWRGACGTRPACTLPVGTVEVLRAVFARR